MAIFPSPWYTPPSPAIALLCQLVQVSHYSATPENIRCGTNVVWDSVLFCVWALSVRSQTKPLLFHPNNIDLLCDYSCLAQWNAAAPGAEQQWRSTMLRYRRPRNDTPPPSRITSAGEARGCRCY